MPVGTIIAWPSGTLPGGLDAGKWLICNGQSTVGYPDLALVVGATVPDYRGYFLRGLGGNSAALGVAQGDAIRNITGTFGEASQGYWWSPAGAFYQTGATYYGNGADAIPNSYYVAFDASRVVPTANENRPLNKSVLWLIRAKL